MVQIFDACEQHNLELLEDGIYRNNEKLGSVGFTNGNWCFIRTSSERQKRACDSADEAVRRCKAACRETSLLVVETVSYEELLDQIFDELSADEWLLVMGSEPVRELVAA
jgi:hypothetical protein